MEWLLLVASLQLCTITEAQSDKGKPFDEYAVYDTYEFYGSLDEDESGTLVFYHVPTGFIKPAVVYQHKLTFVKRSDKYKAIKNIGKNVKITGSILKLQDFEIVIVEKLEVLFLEI